MRRTKTSSRLAWRVVRCNSCLPSFVDRLEQSRDGQVRFANVETDQTIVLADRLHSRQRPPASSASPLELPLTWNSTM